MPANPLTSVGLILGMMGVAIIFVWGPPQPFCQEYVAISVEDGTRMPDGRTAKEHVEDEKRKKKFYRTMASVGLALIFFGFALQLLDSWS
jgi:hypothetical protein